MASCTTNSFLALTQDWFHQVEGQRPKHSPIFGLLNGWTVEQLVPEYAGSL